MCITDRHDMTSAAKVALNPNTNNQQKPSKKSTKFHEYQAELTD